MKKPKSYHFIFFLLILVLLQILIFHLIISKNLRISGEFFASFLSNLFEYDNFVVAKLDDKFNDFQLNQNFSNILKEGPNEYIQGIYYPGKTLKYVKKNSDGYLLYEIPVSLVNLPETSDKIYLVAVDEKVVFSNNNLLIGNNISKIKLFSVSSQTKQGFKVVVGYEFGRIVLYDLLLSLPLVFLFIIFYLFIYYYSSKYKKIKNSIRNIFESLQRTNELISKNTIVDFYECEIEIPELKTLQNELKNMSLNFSKILEKQKKISKEYEKILEQLEITHEILLSRNIQLISALAEAVEIKDSATGNHSKKVVELSLEIARVLGINDEDELETIRYGAILHDIGKIGIPESILNKPSKLTPEEFEIMKKHTIFGEKIIKSVPGFDLVADIIRHHHENYDGSGYPDGLVGEESSLRTQIVSIADVFTALTEDRPYRKALRINEAIELIKSMVGTKFSKQIFDAFLKALDRYLNDID
jgi:putative nucleotidyltransferase with HDIG domain